MAGYFRNIVGSRKMARELVLQGRHDETYKCASSEEAMRSLMDRLMGQRRPRPNHGPYYVDPAVAAAEAKAAAEAGEGGRRDGSTGRGWFEASSRGGGGGLQEQSISYRESLRLAGSSSGVLPRLAAHEAGVSESSAAGSGAGSGAGRGAGFRWADDKEAVRGAFPGRPALEQQRAERRRAARQTDPHTQKVAAPTGFLDPHVYETARRVLSSRQGTAARQGTAHQADGATGFPQVGSPSGLGSGRSWASESAGSFGEEASWARASSFGSEPPFTAAATVPTCEQTSRVEGPGDRNFLGAPGSTSAYAMTHAASRKAATLRRALSTPALASFITEL